MKGKLSRNPKSSGLKRTRSLKQPGRPIFRDGAQRDIPGLPALTRTERQQQLFEWNDTHRDYPNDKCIHHLFEEQANRTPDALALIFGNERLTYRELNQRANQLAHHLIDLGICTETVVGICVERSLEMIIGILGILKAGGAYLPLDPTWPKERISYVLEDCQAKALVTRREHTVDLNIGRTKTVYLDWDGPAIGRRPENNPESKTRPDNLVYVIYTSGSTGAPKGAEVQHNSLTNYSYAIREQLKIDQPLHFATVSTIAADLGNTCIFPSLISGGCLHVIDYDTSMSAERFREYTKQHSIDVLKITPSHFRALMGSGEESIPLPAKYLILGGEPLSVELIRKITTRKDMTCTIVNHYGPTEATVGSLMSVVQRNQSFQSRTVPIGRPIANARAHVLDVNRQPVPMELSGELYLGGIGLARGYRGRPELTREKFVPNPFAEGMSGSLYRTGDLVRYLPSGEIEYLGRIDDQVKIRGFRVELGEVEAAISTFSSIKEIAVVAKEIDAMETLLLAYFVSNHREPVNIGDLRKHLARTLPDHMIPTRFFELDELPLTRNGKVDRKALADRPVRPTGQSKTVSDAGRDAIEQKLLEIWESILGIDHIDVRDNFFELGGHSLQAVRMFAEVEETFGKNIRLATLFEAGTIEKLADVVRNEAWAAPESCLVPIQPNGTKPPFFCVHAKGGNVLFYRDLSEHLGNDQPFYGIQARRVGGRQVAHSTVEEMAAFYIKEILAVQPEGPYYIGGSSFGGLAAFEIAQQLTSLGHKVALLALLDTGTKDYPKLLPGTSRFRRRINDRIRQGQKHLDSLLNLDARGKAKYAIDKAKKIDLRLRRKLRNTYKKVARLAYLKVKGAGSIPKQYFQVEDQIARAGQIYSPKPYNGHATLFRAAHQPVGIQSDPTLGWGMYVQGSLEIHEVPGHHGSIVAEPYVKVLAEKLSMCISRAHDTVEKQTSGEGSGTASGSV
jgi:amino acid adenylation domain-containing protein